MADGTAQEWVFVSGASQGLGRAIAVGMANARVNATTCVHIVISARNEEKLNALADELNTTHGDGVVVTVIPCDMSDVNGLDAFSEAVTATAQDPSRFSAVFIIHNAGSLGPLLPITEHPAGDASVFAAATNLNLVSVMCLTPVLVRHFADVYAPESGSGDGTRVFVVNISSLYAVETKLGFAIYAANKHGRDAYFATLAKEMSETKLKVLNWAPGPLATEMLSFVRDHHPDTVYASATKAMFDDGSVIKVEETTAKMIGLLTEDSFATGAHIDYYDDEN